MKAWTIPVSWAMCGEVIPSDGEYVDSSWTLSTEDEQFIRNYYNNNQSDDAE